MADPGAWVTKHARGGIVGSRWTMECLDESVVIDFVEGRLSLEQRDSVDAHIDSCPACAQVVAGLVRIYGDSRGSAPDQSLSETEASHPAEIDPGAEVPHGTLTGRYVVLGRVGAGAMGVVYAAYDPELDRKVALKLLRGTAPDEPQSEGGRTRLLREAQAMARLAHPNVITVHDVGTFEDRVFIAMEFCDGPTLKRWVKDKTRTWRETLQVFVAAGRGLMAAHEAGLVHRDFKPDNVLIGRDGRVLVMDFGLARPAESAYKPRTATGVREVVDPPERVLAMTLTRPGTLVGTPAYMAPEQLHGESTSTHSDQFSFCIALYEALYGERPFAGKSIAELADNIDDGKLRPPPRDAHVPGWLRRAIVRGLAAEPVDRYPHMQALIEALQRDPARTWRRSASIMLPTVVMAVGLMSYQRDREAQAAFCASAERRLAGVWDPDQKRAMQSAFLTTGKPFAADAWEAVRVKIDDFVRGWASRHQAVCEAQLSGDEPEPVLTVRMVCLHRQLEQLRAITNVLADADSETVERAVNVVQGLPDLERCEDVDALLEKIPPPPGPGLRELESVLASTPALQRAGKYEAAQRASREVVEQARELGFRRAEAEALLNLARVEEILGNVVQAERLHHEALSAAIASEHDEAMAKACIGLTWLIGNGGRRFPEAERWASHAAGAIERLENATELEAQLADAHGQALLVEGQFDRAELMFRHSLAIRERADDKMGISVSCNNLGTLLGQTGRVEEAIVEFRRAKELAEEVLGAHHPNVALSLDNVAVALSSSDRFDEAFEHHRRALVIREAALGPDHLRTATSLNNIAIAMREQGELEACYQYHQRARAIAERYGVAGQDDVVIALSGLGSLAQDRGNLDESEMYHRAALELRQRAYGPENPGVARSLNNLGWIMIDKGAHVEARPLLERSATMRERIFGGTYAELASSLTGLGSAARVLGESRKAIALLERAAWIRGVSSSTGYERATTQFELALALWTDPRQRKRARRVAQRAREGVLAARPDDTDAVAKIQAWIDAHGEGDD